MPHQREWGGGGGGGSLPSSKNRSPVREWWHKNLREHGRYPCYAIILVLPSDTEAVNYLKEFGHELHLISGEKCLIITLNQTQFSIPAFPAFDETIWEKAMNEHVLSGYSARVAQLLDISFDRFPCLVIFEDIRSSNHVVVTLKDMTAKEISEKLRAIFSVVQEAINDGENPLSAIDRHRNQESFLRAGQTIVGHISNLAGKTFEKAMEAWVKATIE
jgi:hypothetical protein